jgi:hypothetical protein
VFFLAISEKAQEILRQGSIKLRVNRSGMFQQITFRTKVAKLGNIEYNELFTERVMELSELAKIAEEFGLPVEAPNGRAFPKGKGAADFQVG